MTAATREAASAIVRLARRGPWGALGLVTAPPTARDDAWPNTLHLLAERAASGRQAWAIATRAARRHRVVEKHRDR